MKHDIYHPVRLLVAFLVIVLLAVLFVGCGSIVQWEARDTPFGAVAVRVQLPAKEGFAK